jgi:hypothetical protein
MLLAGSKQFKNSWMLARAAAVIVSARKKNCGAN